MQNSSLYSAIRQSLVLIVEPSSTFRTSLANALQNTGLRLAAVGSGQEALTVIRKSGMPSLAIIEISLPDMSGLELATRLKRRNNMPIILTTYGVESGRIASMLDLVAEDFIPKPTDEREIAARALHLLLHHLLATRKVERHFRTDYERRGTILKM